MEGTRQWEVPKDLQINLRDYCDDDSGVIWSGVQVQGLSEFLERNELLLVKSESLERIVGNLRHSETMAIGYHEMKPDAAVSSGSSTEAEQSTSERRLVAKAPMSEAEVDSEMPKVVSAPHAAGPNPVDGDPSPLSNSLQVGPSASGSGPSQKANEAEPSSINVGTPSNVSSLQESHGSTDLSPQPVLSLTIGSNESMEETPDEDVQILDETQNTTDVASGELVNGRPQRKRKALCRYPYAVTHRKKKTNSNTHECECGVKFPTEEKLASHLSTKVPRKFKCDSCISSFLTKSDLSAHYKSNVNQCKRTTRGRMNTKEVKQQVARGKKHEVIFQDIATGVVTCICGQKFASIKKLKVHAAYYMTPWQFKCMKAGCRKEFQGLPALKQHLRSNHGVANPLKSFRAGCKMCGKMFKMSSELKLHQGSEECSNFLRSKQSSSRQEENTIDADGTGPSTSGASSLDLPPESVADIKSTSTEVMLPETKHYPDLQLYRCACGNSFPTSTHLSAHIYSRILGAVYSCSNCCDVFQTYVDWQRHTTVPFSGCGNVTEVACVMCEKNFANAKVFNIHKQKCTHYNID